MALAVLVGAGVRAQQAAPGTVAHSARNASYAISARLDPASRTLTGDELLTWRNTSRIPATTLQFHLYFNAWRNSRSTWMRERASRTAALAVRRQRDWGWTDLTSLRVIPRGGT